MEIMVCNLDRAPMSTVTCILYNYNDPGRYNPVSGQNVAQLSELRRFDKLFVLPRVLTSKKIEWIIFHVSLNS